jgi:hypothetical protein
MRTLQTYWGASPHTDNDITVAAAPKSRIASNDSSLRDCATSNQHVNLRVTQTAFSQNLLRDLEIGKVKRAELRAQVARVGVRFLNETG